MIPGWETLTRSLLQLASRLVSVPYIGWDICVIRDGFVVIEGNNRPDVNLMQIHRPLLLDARVQRFYKDRGVIN